MITPNTKARAIHGRKNLKMQEDKESTAVDWRTQKDLEAREASQALIETMRQANLGGGTPPPRTPLAPQSREALAFEEAARKLAEENAGWEERLSGNGSTPEPERKQPTFKELYMSAPLPPVTAGQTATTATEARRHGLRDRKNTKINTFALVPRSAALHRTISGRGFQLFLLASTHDLPKDGARSGLIFPSEATLATEMGVGVRRVKTLLHELEALGWITTEAYDRRTRRVIRRLLVRVEDPYEPKEPYALVPKSIALSRKLNRRPLMLYVLLLSYDLPKKNGKRNGIVFPSEATLAKALGITVRQVQRQLKELEAAKWIETSYYGHHAVRKLMITAASHGIR